MLKSLSKPSVYTISLKIFISQQNLLISLHKNNTKVFLFSNTPCKIAIVFIHNKLINWLIRHIQFYFSAGRFGFIIVKVNNFNLKIGFIDLIEQNDSFFNILHGG